MPITATTDSRGNTPRGKPTVSDPDNSPHEAAPDAEPDPEAPAPDSVTGSTEHATGTEQAAQNR